VLAWSVSNLKAARETKDLALDPHLPLPLRSQLQLIQSDILSVALYPTAVKDMDYKSLDVFINRLLNRVTGCCQRFTSATFLRAELGVPSSKYLAHIRALSYFWKLANTSWFKKSLLDIHGDGPIQRFVNLMYEYGLIERSGCKQRNKAAAVAEVTKMECGEWKRKVKEAVLAAAAVKLNSDMENRGLDVSPEPMVAPRPYVRVGGYKARYGLQWRWSLLKGSHKEHGPQGKAFLQEPRHEASDDLPAVHTLAEMLEKDECFPVQHTKCLEDALRAVAQDLCPGLCPEEEIPSWVKPHLRTSLEQLSWSGQSIDGARCVLELFHRLTQVKSRLERRHRDQIANGA
jgi:hypothetical protein